MTPMFSSYAGRGVQQQCWNNLATAPWGEPACMLDATPPLPIALLAVRFNSHNGKYHGEISGKTLQKI